MPESKSNPPVLSKSLMAAVLNLFLLFFIAFLIYKMDKAGKGFYAGLMLIVIVFISSIYGFYIGLKESETKGKFFGTLINGMILLGFIYFIFLFLRGF